MTSGAEAAPSAPLRTTLTVLCSELTTPPPALWESALRAMHPTLADLEVDADITRPDLRIHWDRHVVEWLPEPVPLADEEVAAWIAAGAYDPDIKLAALGHRGHVRLRYYGLAESVLTQYAMLGLVAGVLRDKGGLVIVNPAGHTSFPLAYLYEDGVDWLERLMELPLPLLYCGFVKYEIEGREGIWMRTHGAGHFGVPDVAAKADSRYDAEHYFELFASVLSYAVEQRERLFAGHAMQVGRLGMVRFRAPEKEERVIVRGDNLLVLESVALSS